MRLVIADTYDLLMFSNSKLPKKYRSYDVAWTPREGLCVLWQGDVTVLALPEKGMPGYDFEEFIDTLFKNGGIPKKPKIEYYNVRHT